MDNRRFDALTRALAEGASRRSVLKGLFGGAVALAGSAAARGIISAQTCLDPPNDICPGGGGSNGDGCSCNSGAGICDGDWCVECRIGSDDDCLVTQGAPLCNDNGTNLCQCVVGAQGNVCQLLPTTTTADPCPSDFFCGDECCPTQADYTCCGGSSCCLNEQCNNSSSTCCPTGEFPCGDGCCSNANTCCDGVCCDPGQCNPSSLVCCDTGTFPCGDTCCDNADNCCDGVCCPSSRCNQSVEPDVCCAEGEFACGTTEGNVCCDLADTCTNGQCCPSFAGNSCIGGGGSIPNGCPCGDGATCHEDYCCFDWQICGDVCCEGDSECIACINGQCSLINQSGDCNEGPDAGGGICCGEYCLTLEECCPPYEGNSCTAPGGSIPDRCPCADGATCHEGWCCFDSQICGDACCEGDDECITCVNGQCVFINQGEDCNGGAGICCDQYCTDQYCGECGVECADCEICLNGLCMSTCEPEDACTTFNCINGTCVYEGCDLYETCCENGSAYCADLNFDHADCGACGYACDSCEICFNGSCQETDECCQTIGEPCGYSGDDDDDDDIRPAGSVYQQDCCRGLLCCHAEEDIAGLASEGAMYCAECCADDHCDKGYHCCHGQCIQDHYCCDDHDCDYCEECVYLNGYGYGTCEPAGVPFGEYCHQVTITEGSYQGDCCEGLVCCDVDKDGERCFECCGDWDCPKGAECRHGVCEYECSYDKDCPDDTCCCKSGHCSKHCCDHKKPSKPGTPDDGPYVDTLPSTGSGDTAANAGWMGAAAVGAAAAYFAGKTLRGDHTPAPQTSTEE